MKRKVRRRIDWNQLVLSAFTPVLLLLVFAGPSDGATPAPGGSGPESLASQRSIESLYAESFALESAGKLEDALHLAEAILKRSENGDIRLRMGWLNHLLARHDEALVHYRRAAELMPQSENAQLGVMLSLNMLGRWDEARIQGERILAKAPNNVWAIRYMALSQYMLGNYEEAQKNYRTALANQPGDTLIQLGLGLTLVQLGQIEEGQNFCRQAAPDFTGDERLTFCLEAHKKSWRFRPQVYGFGGFYTDAWDKREFAGGFVGLEALSPIGVGFMLDFTYYWSMQRYESDNLQQYLPGAGLFYASETSLFWMHYLAMIDDAAPDKAGHALALYAGHSFENGIGFGGDAALGIYDGFQTYQLAPELSYQFIPEVAIRLSMMMQARSGDVARVSQGTRNSYSKNLRGSGELGFEFSLPYTQLSVSAYYGERWYTVENKGLLVWNSDDNLVAGTRLALVAFPESLVSASLSFRYDYADHQFGLSHTFHILGFMAGLQANF